MPAVAPGIEQLTLTITEEILVRSSIANTFAALLEQMGPANEGHEQAPMPMVLEARPGSPLVPRISATTTATCGATCRRSRRPRCSRSHGPLFMSAAVVSHINARLKEVEGGTLITFNHHAFGLVPGHAGGSCPGDGAAVRARQAERRSEVEDDL